MSVQSNRFRLNKSQGKLMGVCAGLADYTGIDLMLIRVLTVLLTLCGFGSTVILYLLIGLIAPSNRF
ncbi:PspC domain-containing protein [Sphingomonadaceae bacterium G21617-S1]|jgi:phage shock protein C|uniref:PspC domain-containing protein n=1 Tax=Rhizorhabdus sp. TaxID=1968843 RepID=UPI00121DF15F|nr:PspC domain-containing protein [Rhizorhabdus sp.]MBD3762358.1 PspC domain-containing protein [Rhizorhabdus sp.]MCZ4343901.1 PspC domain-containing protein [Sphingomonadaceae bacterium G21617-S1]TAK09251.1 MAG: PspC domain-containing protein [Rhizorhabdus sp.]